MLHVLPLGADSRALQATEKVIKVAVKHDAQHCRHVGRERVAHGVDNVALVVGQDGAWRHRLLSVISQALGEADLDASTWLADWLTPCCFLSPGGWDVLNVVVVVRQVQNVRVNVGRRLRLGEVFKGLLVMSPDAYAEAMLKAEVAHEPDGDVPTSRS